MFGSFLIINELHLKKISTIFVLLKASIQNIFRFLRNDKYCAKRCNTNWFPISPYLGAELSFQKMIFVRAGLNRFQTVTDIENLKRKVSMQPSAGIGIKYKGLTLDYAITNTGIGGSNYFSNFFSLKLDMRDFRY